MSTELGHMQIDAVALTRQQLVLPDQVAVKYLQADPSVKVIQRDAELIGYELYIVEQWACSRRHPSPVIVTFTGLADHKVSVGILEISKDEDEWSPRLRMYLRSISDQHTRPKATDLGTVMVTSLSSFPSALTVLPISNSSSQECRENFVVNENLKRLGCSGRAGLGLGPPSAATEAKFIQLYHTSELVPVGDAVIELVKLCQVALVMFTKLAPEYVDGLLCDLTERALSDWWTEVGMEYFTVEPSDGVLGPTTVASLLGLYLGARNRLNAFGAPVSKDAFELKTMKRAIAYFQRSQKLTKSRRLDHKTLDRLHKTTSKAANSDGWTVPKAVKTTMAELSGKGGEMVMGMVGARDRSGIAEVETLDINNFVETLSGASCKWLWHGRPRKAQTIDYFVSLEGDGEVALNADERGDQVWSDRPREASLERGEPGRSLLPQLYSRPPGGSQTSFEASDKDQSLHKTVLRSVTDRMSDAKSGIGRFKGVVAKPNRRNHSSRPFGDATTLSATNLGPDHYAKLDPLSNDTSHEVPIAKEPHGGEWHRWPLGGPRPAEKPLEMREDSSSEESASSHGDGSGDAALGYRSTEKVLLKAGSHIGKGAKDVSDITEDMSIGRLPAGQAAFAESYRRRSLPTDWPRTTAALGPDNPQRWLARSVSCSKCDDVILLKRPKDYDTHITDSQQFTEQAIAGEQYSLLRLEGDFDNLTRAEYHLKNLQRDTMHVGGLGQRAKNDLQELHLIFDQKLDEALGIPTAMSDLVREGRQSVTNAFKDAEVLGAKLEYELNALVSKVEDVEDGITEFESQIQDLEARAEDLNAGISPNAYWGRSNFSRKRE